MVSGLWSVIVNICRTYKLCLTPGRSVCSKSFSLEKYQPKDRANSLTISHTKTTPNYTEDHDLNQSSEGEDEELGGAEMHEEEEKRRLNEIIRRLLETFLIILVTVSSILCICLLCLLKFC